MDGAPLLNAPSPHHSLWAYNRRQHEDTHKSIIKETTGTDRDKNSKGIEQNNKQTNKQKKKKIMQQYLEWARALIGETPSSGKSCTALGSTNKTSRHIVPSSSDLLNSSLPLWLSPCLSAAPSSFPLSRPFSECRWLLNNFQEENPKGDRWG